MLWERVQYFSFQHVSGFDTSYACLDSIHALNVIYFFSSHRPKRFWSDRKKLSHFGQKVWKFRLKNTVMVSFNTTVRQMTEMFQWKKTQNVIRAWIRFADFVEPLRWTAVDSDDGERHLGAEAAESDRAASSHDRAVSLIWRRRVNAGWWFYLEESTGTDELICRGNLQGCQIFYTAHGHNHNKHGCFSKSYGQKYKMS